VESVHGAFQIFPLQDRDDATPAGHRLGDRDRSLGDQRIGGPDAVAHGGADSDAYANGDGRSDAGSDTHTNRNSHARAHGGPNPHGSRDADGDTHADGSCNSDTHGHATGHTDADSRAVPAAGYCGDRLRFPGCGR